LAVAVTPPTAWLTAAPSTSEADPGIPASAWLTPGNSAKEPDIPPVSALPAIGDRDSAADLASAMAWFIDEDSDRELPRWATKPRTPLRLGDREIPRD